MNDQQTTALKSSMMLHCGGRHATLDEVYDVEVPDVPAVEFVVKSEELHIADGRSVGRRRQLAGPFFDEAEAHEAARALDRRTLISSRRPRFHPIPHARLIEDVTKATKAAGLRVVDQAHALTKDGARYFGLLQVANGNNPDDFGIIYGLRNAHDYAFKASVALGERVFVCDNLSFSAEVVLGRMHTLNILRDLPGIVAQAVSRLGDARDAQVSRFDAYKAKSLDEVEINDLIIRSLDARAFPVTKIPSILREVREPSHEGFLRDGATTAWTLFNSVTESLKGTNLHDLPRRTRALQGVLDASCGVLVPNLN